jgi:hypothetical protein
MQDSVPLPLFLTKYTQTAGKSALDSFLEYHHLAQITLRTLLNRVGDTVRIYSELPTARRRKILY